MAEVLTTPDHEVTTVIKASPDKVWPLIADVSRMGEWSPICRRCQWLGSPGPRVGAKFVGHNQVSGFRWSRECVVTVAEPGRLFGFSTFFQGRESTRWLYRLEPEGAATRVSEAYQSVFAPRWVRFLRRIPGLAAQSERRSHRGMEITLARIKAAAEGEMR
jgi:uncharacterized protein YndB with AHSA1/START domain